MCRHTCTTCRADMNQREAENHKCPPKPDFTEAARAEAEKRSPSNAPNGLARANNAISRRDFADGAEWARTYLREVDQ